MIDPNPEPIDAPVRIQYEVNRSHLQTAQAVALRYVCSLRSKRPWVLFVLNLFVWMLIAASLMLLFQALNALPEAHRNTAWFGLGGLFLAACMTPALEAVRRDQMNRRMIELQGPFPQALLMSLDASGVQVTSAQGHGRYPARSIAAVVDAQGMFTIVLRSGFALPVPYSAFESDSQRQEAIRLLQFMCELT